MNQTIISGNIGQDATIKDLDGQSAINFSVAVTDKWKNKQGEKQERTTWVSCVMWKPSDKTSIAQYLKKGTKVLLTGESGAEAYVDKEGKAIAKLTLKVSNVEFIGSIQADQKPESKAPVQTYSEHELLRDGDSDLPF